MFSIQTYLNNNLSSDNLNKETMRAVQHLRPTVLTKGRGYEGENKGVGYHDRAEHHGYPACNVTGMGL